MANPLADPAEAHVGPRRPSIDGDKRASCVAVAPLLRPNGLNLSTEDADGIAAEIAPACDAPFEPGLTAWLSARTRPPC